MCLAALSILSMIRAKAIVLMSYLKKNLLMAKKLVPATYWLPLTTVSLKPTLPIVMMMATVKSATTMPMALVCAKRFYVRRSILPVSALILIQGVYILYLKPLGHTAALIMLRQLVRRYLLQVMAALLNLAITQPMATMCSFHMAQPTLPSTYT